MNPKPPSRQPAPPASTHQVRDQLRLFLIMLLGLILVSGLTLPFALGGLPLGALTLWTGVRLMILLNGVHRAGGGSSGRLTVIIGLILTGVLTTGFALQALYYRPTVERERCLAAANTLTAEKKCEQTYLDSVREMLERLEGTG